MKTFFITVFIYFLMFQPSFAQDKNREVYRIPGHENVENMIGFNQAIKVGNTLYISGTVDGLHEDMESQITTIYKYVEETLKNFDATSVNIVKENVFTTNLEEFKKHIALRKKFYNENQFPTSTWVEVKSLFIPKLKVEIEFVAVI